MLCLRWPYLMCRQMNTGTFDFRPPSGSGYPAIPNQDDVAPSYDVVGIGFAREGATADTIHELIAFVTFSGGSSPAVLSDRRPPDGWQVTLRDESTEFSGVDDDEAEAFFKSAVSAFRSSHGEAIAVMESLGVRHDNIQPKSAFANLTQATGTFDILDADSEVVGCAFVARTGATTTSQHWVMFDNHPFNAVRCERRATGGYSNLHAFLDAMHAQRAAALLDYPHAVEVVTHYLDVPWS